MRADTAVRGTLRTEAHAVVPRQCPPGDGARIGVRGTSAPPAPGTGPQDDDAVTERLATPRGQTRARRLLPALAALLLVVPLVGGALVPPRPVNADELSSALSRQKALAARIASQRALIARLNGEQATLKSAIAATNESLAAVSADLSAVKARLGSLGERIAEVKRVYAALVAEVAALDLELVDLDGQAVKKEAELAVRQRVLGERLRAAYRTERTSLLETLLSSRSFADALTSTGYLVDLANQDKVLATAIRTDQETLATLRETAAETRDQTDALRVETARQRKALADRIAEEKAARAQLTKLQSEVERRLAVQQSNFEKLAKNKAAAQAAMAESVRAQESLQRRIKALIAQQSSLGRIPSRYNGTLAWPMRGVVTQRYGCTGFSWEPRRGNCRHWHNGIDIAADLYTPVRAAGDGRVVFAGPNPYDRYPKAWIVIIAHSEELQTWYAHLDNRTRPIPVRAGQWVTKGQVIGYEGMTGRTTGPHLHFMVELNDRFVDPRLFI